MELMAYVYLLQAAVSIFTNTYQSHQFLDVLLRQLLDLMALGLCRVLATKRILGVIGNRSHRPPMVCILLLRQFLGLVGMTTDCRSDTFGNGVEHDVYAAYR
jgi:hypothetical protein